MALNYFAAASVGYALITGLSTDTKPSSPGANWRFQEIDTGRTWYVVGGVWTEGINTTYASTAMAVVTTDSRLSDARTPTAHTHPKADVGLGNVDNTTDAGKPVSTAQQTALNLKANLASPAFTGTVTTAALSIGNASDVTISGITGTKFGQSGSKLGFFGVTPVVRPTALTQTYATTSSTHAAVTQLAAPAGGTGAAAGGWNTAANRDLAITSINAARTDIANLKNFVNQIVDQLQALGLLQ